MSQSPPSPSYYSFQPKEKLPFKELDLSKVLDDVFADFLKSVHPSFEPDQQGLEEEVVAEEDNVKCKHKRLVEDSEDKLAEFFKQQTPSEIKLRLNEHFDNLKSTQSQLTKHSLAKKCDHLPRGFSKDQVLVPPPISCARETSRCLAEDEHLSLIIEPPQIVFNAYSVGSTYKKKCWVRNRSGSLLKGRIIQPLSPDWSLNCSGKLMLSTGLSVQIIVSFTPSNLKPQTSSFSVIVQRGVNYQKKDFIIPLIASREAPSLIGFEEYKEEDEEETCWKYLDGGKALIGSTLVTKVQLTNRASPATFILTNQPSATFSQLALVEEDYIEIEPFSLKPCKLTLDRDESVEIEITFNPQRKDTFVENMYVLCTDDICNDSFQLVAEGISLSRQHFLFSDLDKCFPIYIEDDMLADNYIDLTTMFPNGTQRRTFSVLNKCSLPMKYHWENRQAQVDSDYLDIPENCLKITPAAGILMPMKEKKFHLTCRMKSAKPNIYKSAVSLIIDELTEECLEEGNEIYAIRPEDSSFTRNQMISFNSGEIEVWLKVIFPHVTVTPNMLEMTLTGSNQSNLMMAAVKNLNEEEVTVEWIRNNPTNRPNIYIRVEPGDQVKIAKKSQIIFHIRAGTSHVPCFGITSVKETFSCLVNDGENCIDLSVNVNLIRCEQDIDKSDNSDSGSLSQQLPPTRDLIHLQPSSRDELMRIFENKIKEIMSKVNCSSNSLQYDSDIADLLSSAMNCIAAEGLVYGVSEWEDEVNWVIGDVRGHDVILVPCCMNLFLFHQFHDRNTVTLHNRSLMPTKYRWGASYGCNKDMLKIWLSKSEGGLGANSKTTIDLYIFPLQYGEITDLHIPCYIEHLKEPLVLSLSGLVEPLRILLQWDIDKGFYQTSWDPAANDSFLSSMLKDQDLGGLQSDYKQALGDTPLLKIVKEGISELCGTLCRGDIDLPEISTNTVLEDLDLTKSELPDSNLLVTDQCGPLGCQFGNVVSRVLNDKALRFTIPIGKSKTQVVNLKNLTPIKTSFSVKAEIFWSKVEAPEYPSYFSEDNLYNLEEPTYYEGSSQLKQKDTERRKIGLYLKVDPNIREINSYQDIEIAVTATPDVWGEYFDVLVVSVSGLPSYSVPVCVDAIGSPLSFTFDPRPLPHLRFGTLTSNEESSYEVTLRNNCYVPLKIAWTIYCKPFQWNGDDESCADIPFSVAVNLHDPISENFCKLDVIDYLGLHQDNPYQVSPGVTYIAPYGEVKMNISVKVPELSDEGLLEGTCVGLIYEDPYQRNKWRSLCQRKTGLSQLFKLKLTTNVEIPKIQIISGDKTNRHLCYMVTAKDVVEKGSVVLKRQYVLRNVSRAETRASVQVDPPYTLTDIVPKDTKSLKVNIKDNSFIIRPHQTFAVNISMKITKDMLNEDEELLTEELQSIVQTNKQALLYINQPHVNKTQEVVLNYGILYPFLQFSTKRLVFGPVFVNETRVKVIRITPITGVEKLRIEPHGDYYQKGESPFSFSPSSAVVQQGGYLELAVSFNPKESMGYLDELKIKTSVPQCNFYVVMEGVGTWNYKFHQILKQLKN